MVVELDDTSKVKDLFAGWQETLIYSCVHVAVVKNTRTAAGNSDKIRLCEYL